MKRGSEIPSKELNPCKSADRQDEYLRIAVSVEEFPPSTIQTVFLGNNLLWLNPFEL
ncbi:hypothetical protein MSUIS_07550 [Mycoplasma suis KI3806]|uniref:Uncharacterized protein n=1 Tax=Mycoplasma suis (strain KI_3806) TaxID=708248 RepID=F0V2G7_MYCS3|nr:hypothetical protein MSUIS_07550 [Mycoplasma suis KI3806]